MTVPQGSHPVDSSGSEPHPDTVRLDWLWEQMGGHCSNVEGEYWSVYWHFPVVPERDDGGWPDDIRDAIEAAREAEGE